MEPDLSLHGADGFKPSAATLCAMFDHAVAAAPDSVALRHLDAVLTYRELGRAVEALAQRLATMVEPGETVALVLPNSIEFHLAYFAALKALAAPALLNPVYPGGSALAAAAGSNPARYALRADHARDGGRSRQRSGHSRRGLPGAGHYHPGADRRSRGACRPADRPARR